MKRITLLALALFAALSAFACAAGSAPVRVEEAAAGDQVLVMAAATPAELPADGLAPLTIVRGVQSFGDGYIVYPKVSYCAYAEEINDSMLALTASRAQQVSTSIFTKYRIEYNRNGLFSLRMELYDIHEYEGKENARLETVYMTYDVEAGRLCTLGDLFDQEDDRWRGIMPDIITAQAEARGITLLCDVMPVTDNQQFFITGDEVVLVYELYEIATYAAGEPEFALPISQLSAFIPEGSPLSRVLGAEEASAKERQGEKTPQPTPALRMTDSALMTREAESPATEQAPGEQAAEAMPRPERAGSAGEGDTP